MTALGTGWRTSYAAFATTGEPPLSVAGKLMTPMEGDEVPGVLICHGSDGVDGRGAFHAEALNDAGIATFEIDMWAARGVKRGALARPRSVPETLPDAFAALAFLARQPEIDPERLNVNGGAIALGHPVGATGVGQICDVAQQIRGEAGERQVARNQIGLAQNLGGSGATSVVSILGAA